MQRKSSSDETKELRSHIMRWKLRTINTFSECIFVQWLKQHYSVHYYCNPSCTIEIKSSQVNAINSFYNSKWQSACSSISIALHCTFAPFDSYSLYIVQGVSCQSVFFETPARVSNYDIFDNWELAAWFQGSTIWVSLVFYFINVTWPPQPRIFISAWFLLKFYQTIP